MTTAAARPAASAASVACNTDGLSPWTRLEIALFRTPAIDQLLLVDLRRPCGLALLRPPRERLPDDLLEREEDERERLLDPPLSLSSDSARLPAAPPDSPRSAVFVRSAWALKRSLRSRSPPLPLSSSDYSSSSMISSMSE